MNPTCDQFMRFQHKIYWRPPDGEHARSIHWTFVNCDFTQDYEIDAIFCSRKWLAVRFTVDGNKVWTNVRKYNAWWAAIVP